MNVLTFGYCLVDYRNGIRSVMKMTDGGGELWRECVRWLVEVGVLRPDHKVAAIDATMVEFAFTLRDGVLLCRLINELVPDAVDPKEIPTQVHHLSEFQCQKIICLFLGACQTVFNLKEPDMFVAWELFHMTCFIKVLNTLSMLSYSEPALKRGIKPFPSRARPVPSRLQPPPEEEDIYRNLKDDVDNVDLDCAIYDAGPYVHMYDEEPTKIYDHIVARQDSKREHKTDVWSTFQPTTKREHCIKELLDTEQNYVEKALNMIMNKFHAPLQSHMKNPKDHETIFMNITDLWNLHHAFYNDLRQSVLRTLGLNKATDGRPTSLGKFIGEVFLLHKDKFIAYGHYCSHLDESRGKIMELEKNDASIRQKILECTAAVNENQFKLQDLLCLPLQRVLKYHILLSEMIKSTPVDSLDRRSLEQAKDAMEDINAYVNEMKRDNETSQLIKDVERSIADLAMPEGVSLLDYGRLNTDGEVRLSESTESTTGKTKQRHVFVFDKVLIICQARRNNTYTYKGAYILHELSIDQDGPHGENKFGTITKKLGAGSQHVLHLLRDSREERMNPSADVVRHLTLTFKAKNQLEKWVAQFQVAKDNVQPACVAGTGHRVHYQSFKVDFAHKCTVCDKFLRGLMYQGYKCDSCGGVMHKSCIGLRPCPGRRQPSVTPNASFCHGQDSNGFRRRQFAAALCKGDQVIAMCRIDSSDSSYLSFNRDDVIEVLQFIDDTRFMGCLVNNRQQTGFVKSDLVRRVRSNSMVNLNGFSTSLDSPIGSASGRIDRKESTVLPRRPASHAMTPAAQPDYMNTEVTTQVWYMGNVERAEAERKLKPTPNGTFLVRYSANRCRYAISISYEGDVKHTVVEQSDDGTYYLDEGYVFNSIVELVNYYQEHNLCESFNTLNTTLKSPYRECKVFRVLHDFEQGESKFLSLRKGDVLTLVDTVGEDRGWWKGSINNRVGFFPLSYVEPVGDEELPSISGAV